MGGSRRTGRASVVGWRDTCRGLGGTRRPGVLIATFGCAAAARGGTFVTVGTCVESTDRRTLPMSPRLTPASEIHWAQRHGKQIAVLFLDLDGFKYINDSLGHSIGDRLLQSIAKRLEQSVRASDTVSRQGGDEFVVLLSEEERWGDAATVAGRMLGSVAEAHSIADTAMYNAKENGRQSYQFFKPDMNVRAVERQSIEEGLRRALERREFTLHYQPKINLRTGAAPKR